MAQVTNSHRCLELIHFGVSADVCDFFRSVDAEIFQVVKLLCQAAVMIANRTALNGVEDLRRMEAVHGCIPEGSARLSLVCHAKCVRCIIDHLQVIFLRNSFDLFHITHVAVNMNRNDRTGLVCDQIFDFGDIHGVIFRIDVAEHRLQSVSHNCMRCRCKCKRCRNYLAALGKIKRSDYIFQRKMSVHIQRHMGHVQHCLQFCL